jgi:hypothetical protein
MTYVAPVGLDCSRETYRTVLRLNRVKTRPRCQVRADDRTGPRPPAVAHGSASGPGAWCGDCARASRATFTPFHFMATITLTTYNIDGPCIQGTSMRKNTGINKGLTCGYGHGRDGKARGEGIPKERMETRPPDRPASTRPTPRTAPWRPNERPAADAWTEARAIW